MTKKIGQVRRKFLTRERLMLITEHLIRGEKQRRWTPSQQMRWKKFLSEYEKNIDRIYHQLRYQVWEPEPFIIFDKPEGRKVRRIYESHPESLLVDTLLLDCLNYVFFEKKQIIPDSSYGSIKGRGQHELREKIIRLVHGREDLYVWTGDTAKYYPTIHQGILMQTIRKHVKDEWMLWLCKICLGRIEGMRGIALGLPSSNPVGHIYHAILDWYVILTLKVRRYYRFCDDKWAMHRDKNYLHTVARRVKEETSGTLSQEIKPSWRVLHCKEQYFECLGAVVNSHGARLKSYNRRRVERHMKKAIRHGDPEKALRAWSGIKGSLRNLNVSNLVNYWHDRYPEFFHLVKWQYKILKENRRRKLWHRKLEKILTNAVDNRSLYNFVVYPYGLDNATAQGEAA